MGSKNAGSWVIADDLYKKGFTDDPCKPLIFKFGSGERI
ncbi:Uncharacterized protein dnl_03340 [Desulfonema limicola]|uniref:Uncharacterized protein n=1 Tax=Desulfonema limicola TaxID=45656 RepID=A0A975B3I5_9BACT|nr:Uncharacterized protein dnl_03340 [Desulfonema limicola]